MGEISNCINDNILDLKGGRESSDEEDAEEGAGKEGDIEKYGITKESSGN